MSLKIFIGSSANGEDAPIESIYEYTLRKNCTQDIEITWMRQTNNQKSYWANWKTEKWYTPFSGFRWGIAEACNFNGRALYTDTDMINLKDISELFLTDMKQKPFAARIAKRFNGYQPCVMLIDCEKAKDVLKSKAEIASDENSHNIYMKKLIKKKRYFWENSYFSEIDKRWNCLDGEDLEINEIYQLHFTKMSTQPWKPSWFKGDTEEHQRKDILDLYYSLLEEASENGFKPTHKKKDTVIYNIIGK